ncbi:MAG: 2-phospho-L-lactate guanylyltransferase [Hadesarchaea archaeon]|nr:MAG: 2-phospho-L-lactate guanylyltransferase [Hadesarchaea archaeon]
MTGGWILLPVKHLSKAKSSFEKVLSPEERKELVLCMLSDMLAVLSGVEMRKVVVSPDEEVLRFASERGAEGLKEPGLELNLALSLAVEKAVREGMEEVLILPADLPFLRVKDVEGIRGMASSQREVVIAPSKTRGTNALFLRPPNVIPLRFGGESFPLHVRESLRVGITPKIYQSDTVATDVDEVEDLLKAGTLGLGTRTLDFLLSLGKHKFVR